VIIVPVWEQFCSMLRPIIIIKDLLLCNDVIQENTTNMAFILKTDWNDFSLEKQFQCPF
jgi:hypothetical protein